MTSVARNPVHHRLVEDSLLASAARAPGKEAVVAGDVRLTYGELLDSVLRLARAFQDLGVERGDRVVLYMENSASCCVALYATLLAGGVFVVVNPQTKRDKLAFILDDCQAALLVTEGSIAPTGHAAAGDAEAPPPVVVAARSGDLPGTHDFDALIRETEPSPAPPGTIPCDLSALIYTSGSTGTPKGVMIKHESMVFATESISEYLRLGESDRILGVLPLAFDYGLYQCLMAIRLGATLVLERSFAYPAHIVNRVRDEEITVFPGVPTVYAMLLSAAESSAIELPSVTRVTNTAAALPPSFHDDLRRIFPNTLIFRMYGLTECKRVSYLEPELVDELPTSVGRAIPGTEAMVLRPDGTPVDPGEVGVLYVRGPHVMAGYWQRPDLTAEMLVEGPVPGERMLCTHDHFTVDEAGFLYFVGRTDDIIKTRGEKVSPLEVEAALFAIDGIKEAAVIGVPDDVLGQAIRAFVVLNDDADLDEKAIIATCRTRLESFMVPRDVVFLDELPTTPTGKVRKKSLVELAG